MPAFCSYLEKHLGLADRAPQEFDAAWLTVEGLARSKGEFGDFMDPGIWGAHLARDPATFAKTLKPTSAVDRDLTMMLSWGQWEEPFSELGAKGDDSKGLTVPGFPLLSWFQDVTNDVIYGPNEVDAFLSELLRAHEDGKGPKVYSWAG